MLTYLVSSKDELERIEHIEDLKTLFPDLVSIDAIYPKNTRIPFYSQIKSTLGNYLHIDLFINTSSSEGVPVSIMEALSVGIPIIATDVGGTKEIVTKTTARIASETRIEGPNFRPALALIALFIE